MFCFRPDDLVYPIHRGPSFILLTFFLFSLLLPAPVLLCFYFLLSLLIPTDMAELFFQGIAGFLALGQHPFPFSGLIIAK